MRKTIVRLGAISLLVVVLLITGCTKAQTPTQLPSVLNLATHAMGSKDYAMAAGIASVLSAHLSTEIKVMPTSGPIEFLPMLRSGEVELGLLNLGDARGGWLAAGAYEKPLEGKGVAIRLLCAGSPVVTSVLTAADSGIVTAQDLKGKRVVVTVSGSPGITTIGLAHLANLGLTPDDVVQITVPSIADAAKAITEGRADAAANLAMGVPAVTELDAKRGARYLSLDSSPQAVKRMQEIWPGRLVKVEPGSIGVAEPTYFMATDKYLAAYKTLSDKVAYQIVKTLWDYNSELGPIHVSLKTWTTDRFVTSAPTIPYHPGAIKFYKEKEVWNSGQDKIQEELLGLER